MEESNHRNKLNISFLAIAFLFLLNISIHASISDSAIIKIHFLYGSRPFKLYKSIESKWFGGMLGGHVGIEIGKDSVLSFLPKCKFNLFQRKSLKCGYFTIQSVRDFYEVLGGRYDSVKRTEICVPITIGQKSRLYSISAAYTKKTPFDYAFFGMRCAAAAYYVMGKAGILEMASDRLPWLEIFYPKILRRKLLALSERNNWSVVRKEGTKRRKWEKD
jgi:hypothetical protein